MESPDPLRRHLVRALEWEEAHVSFERAFQGVPAEHRGRSPDGLPFSLWQLLEHIRTAQRDLLDFSRDPDFRHPDWPDDFWPTAPEPPDREAWTRSLEAAREDRRALQALVADARAELLRPAPSGTESQTFLRSILLVVDHTSYHVGQAVLVRRLLGSWPPSDD